MVILGISAYYHDSAATIIRDGHILFAAQEERYTRKKNDSSFPLNAVKHGLSYCNLSIHDIDIVVYYEKPLLKFERIIKSYLDVVPKGFISFLQAMHVWTKEKLFLKQNIYATLKEADSSFKKENIKLLFTEHHLSHAASAFFPSPFENAAILTTDGVGEYATTTLCYGEKNTIQLLKEIHYPHSLGLLYSAITYFLGFKVNSDEYKVMGLAAYGNRDAEETIQFINTIEKELITIHEDGSYTLNMNNFAYTTALTMVHKKKWARLFNVEKRETEDAITQTHCNLAFAFQKVTEKVVLLLCNEIKKITSSENLCLAGGVALNCVINGIIKDKKIFKHIFIQPASGDSGGALGAALAAHYIFLQEERTIIFPDAQQNSLLGNSYSDNDLTAILSKHKNHIVFNNEEDLVKKTASLIAAGNVIGWFQGRMEFGPRALGNRSILADARNPDMQLHLNLKIKNRESFRPFAPAVLEEDAAHYFCMEGTSPYMLQVHQLKSEHLMPVPPDFPEMDLKKKLYFVKSSIPAVTHVDFTARVQTVNSQQHPLFYKLIREFKHQTGCGLLVNTSFNVKDEPIACSPEDAYYCFINTNMDILVLHNCLFFKKDIHTTE